MPYTIEWEQGVVLISFCDVATAIELGAAVEEIHENRFYKLARYTLLDFLEVERAEASVLNIVKLASEDKKIAAKNPGRTVVMVADQPEIIRLAKLYQLEMNEESWQTKVFGTMVEARQWIEVESA